MDPGTGGFRKVLWINMAALASAMVTPVAAQTSDSTRARDTTLVLPPIEIIGSIIPAAGPRIGSGIPARISAYTGRQIDAWEPRTLVDALGSRTGVSIYDDLSSPYKLGPLARVGSTSGPRWASRPACPCSSTECARTSRTRRR